MDNIESKPVLTLFLHANKEDISVSSTLKEKKDVLNVLVKALLTVINTEKKEPSKIIQPKTAGRL